MKKKKQQQRDMREGGRQGEEEERKVFCFSPGSAKRKPVYKAFACDYVCTSGNICTDTAFILIVLSFFF